MANENLEIAELIARSLQAPLDEEQQHRLDAWRLANEENQQLFEKFKDAKWVNAQLAVMYGSDKEARQKRLSHRIVSRSIFIHVKKWYYYTAAACVLIILSVGYWWMNSKKSMPVAQQEERFKNDVPPGSDQRAMLVLADGRTIYLDQAKDGALVQQGSSNVVKRGGELKYESGVGSAAITYNTLRTPRGGQYQLVLPDGSKVWLNAASSLRYPTSFNGERRVELTGEAYFEVVHSGKPFLVSVKGIEVGVLGTEFNINAYDDEEVIKTTLATGKVKVRKGQDNMILKPGQQVQANTAGLKLKEHADLEQALAWKNGTFHFNGESVKEVMRQIERWYDMEVEYETSALGVRIGGMMSRNKNLSEVLKALELNDVHFRIEGRKIIVIK